MKDPAYRLDFFIAIGALLVSALTAATLAYQTHVIGNQYAATVWPYLSVDTTYGYRGETIQIANDGLGPALVQTAQLIVDGRNVPGWSGYVRALGREPVIRKFFVRRTAAISMSSITGSTTLRAGDSKTLFAVAFRSVVPSRALLAHSIALEICYCSLNGTCWMLHATPGADKASHPARVSVCNGSAIISSALNVSPRQP